MCIYKDLEKSSTVKPLKILFLRLTAAKPEKTETVYDGILPQRKKNHGTGEMNTIQVSLLSRKSV